MTVTEPAATPTTSDANASRWGLRRPRYRKNLLRLTPRELNRLRRAFEGLYAISQTTDDDGNVDPAGNRDDERGYQWIAGVHGAPPPVYCEHGSLHFTTWHRAYLYRFEKLLQDQVRTVTLPWWDWASEQAQADGLPPALTDATYVDLVTGETKPNPLRQAFSQVTGSMTERSPSPPAELAVLAAGVAFAMAQADYPSFVQNLENPHNGLHIWVGGDMASVPTAAYDPVFWMHHANVDRIWAMWQQERPDAAIPSDALEFVSEPFNMTGAQVMSTRKLGYAYAAAESLIAAADVRAVAALTGGNGGQPSGATEGEGGGSSEPGGSSGSAESSEPGEPGEGGPPPPSMSFPLDPVEPGFVRATLEVIDLAPPVDSYIVHIFLNNPEATLATPRQMDVGYAGQLALFGHGHCLGGPGHCDVPDRSDDPFDMRPSHHLEPHDTQVDITWPLATLLERQPEASTDGVTVTLVVADANGELADPSVVVFEALAIVLRV